MIGVLKDFPDNVADEARRWIAESTRELPKKS